LQWDQYAFGMGMPGGTLAQELQPLEVLEWSVFMLLVGMYVMEGDSQVIDTEGGGIMASVIGELTSR
jgi:hypothetical protein